jgi:hypothetical protein
MLSIIVQTIATMWPNILFVPTGHHCYHVAKHSLCAYWSPLLPCGQTFSLCLQVTITFETVAFRSYAPFPAILPLLKCVLDVVICEDVQHHRRFCHDNLSYVKIAVTSIGKQRKVAEARVKRIRCVGMRDVLYTYLVKKYLFRKEM